MNALDALLDNEVVVAVLAIMLACYAQYAAPRLSPRALAVVTSWWFRLAVVFLVAFMPTHRFYLALMIAVAFVATSEVLQRYQLLEDFTAL